MGCKLGPCLAVIGRQGGSHAQGRPALVLLRDLDSHPAPDLRQASRLGSGLAWSAAGSRTWWGSGPFKGRTPAFGNRRKHRAGGRRVTGTAGAQRRRRPEGGLTRRRLAWFRLRRSRSRRAGRGAATTEASSDTIESARAPRRQGSGAARPPPLRGAAAWTPGPRALRAGSYRRCLTSTLPRAATTADPMSGRPHGEIRRWRSEGSDDDLSGSGSMQRRPRAYRGTRQPGSGRARPETAWPRYGSRGENADIEASGGRRAREDVERERRGRMRIRAGGDETGGCGRADDQGDTNERHRKQAGSRLGGREPAYPMSDIGLARGRCAPPSIPRPAGVPRATRARQRRASPSRRRRLDTSEGVASAPARVNGFAVLRCAPALRVTRAGAPASRLVRPAGIRPASETSRRPEVTGAHGAARPPSPTTYAARVVHEQPPPLELVRPAHEVGRDGEAGLLTAGG